MFTIKYTILVRNKCYINWCIIFL